MTDPLPIFRRLSVEFDTDKGLPGAVDGVSFEIASGRTVGLVDEAFDPKKLTAHE